MGASDAHRPNVLIFKRSEQAENEAFGRWAPRAPIDQTHEFTNGPHTTKRIGVVSQTFENGLAYYSNMRLVFYDLKKSDHAIVKFSRALKRSSARPLQRSSDRALERSSTRAPERSSARALERPSARALRRSSARVLER